MTMRCLPVTAAGVAILVLAACGASARHTARPSAAQCARWEALTHVDALMASAFARVTTARGLVAAERKLGQVSRDLATGGATFRSYGVPIPKTPPLSSELHRLTTDDDALWIALAANSHGKSSPQAVGDAAQRTMRDIRTIGATCSRK